MNIISATCRLTLWHKVARSGHLDMFRVLLDGIHVQAPSLAGAGAVHGALAHKRHPVAPLTSPSPVFEIALRATLMNSVDDRGHTPLHFAAMEGHAGMLAALLEQVRIVQSQGHMHMPQTLCLHKCRR